MFNTCFYCSLFFFRCSVSFFFIFWCLVLFFLFFGVWCSVFSVWCSVCDDIQHISAIYSDSTSNKKSNGRSQHESTVNDSQCIVQTPKNKKKWHWTPKNKKKWHQTPKKKMRTVKTCIEQNKRGKAVDQTLQTLRKDLLQK